MSVKSTSCLQDWDCGSFQYCNGFYCQCNASYYLHNGFCRQCPGLGESCLFAECCEDSTMACESGYCVCRYYMDSSAKCRAQIPLYITASQIALSAALIMGMAALTMVVYRLCTKPRYLSARQRALASQNGINADSESLTYANYLRASLSSMQIRVLSRLRDRPPAYDNSETRQPAVSLPEAPPPYEGPMEGTSLPPAYTELILNPVGYVNSTFVDTEGGGTLNRSTDSDSNNNNNSNRNNSNSIVSNCDINQSSDGVSEVNKVTECSIEDKAETSDENRIPT